MGRLPPPEECANCGESIPRNARACPGCGADERTGWRETSLYDGLDLPDDASADPTPSRPAPNLLWKGIAVILLIIVVTASVLLRR